MNNSHILRCVSKAIHIVVFFGMSPIFWVLSTDGSTHSLCGCWPMSMVTLMPLSELLLVIETLLSLCPVTPVLTGVQSKAVHILYLTPGNKHEFVPTGWVQVWACGGQLGGGLGSASRGGVAIWVLHP